MVKIFPKLEEFFVSYGSYHDHWINQLIHIVCIPLLYFSGLCLLQSVFPFGTKIYETENLPFFVFNLSTLIHFFLCFLYLNVDLVSGCISTTFYTFLWVVARNWYLSAYSTGTIGEFMKYQGILHVICWIAQFIGHGLFEKRAPALMDNFLLTLVAPDFVIIEILFYFGWRSETRARSDKSIKSNIAEYRSKRKIN